MPHIWLEYPNVDHSVIIFEIFDIYGHSEAFRRAFSNSFKYKRFMAKEQAEPHPIAIVTKQITKRWLDVPFHLQLCQSFGSLRLLERSRWSMHFIARCSREMCCINAQKKSRMLKYNGVTCVQYWWMVFLRIKSFSSVLVNIFNTLVLILLAYRMKLIVSSLCEGTEAPRWARPNNQR